jgi:hypothetical protein
MRSLNTTLPFTTVVALGFFSLLLTQQSAPAALPQASNLPFPSQRFSDLQKAEEPSFRRHVIPLLARLGCSARECHGSFQGRGGFQLSLFGSEWEQDFTALTQKKGNEDELHVNLAHPDQSLIVLKPTLQMKHKGKERYKKNSWQYNMIVKWVQAGAKSDADKTGELKGLEVTPSEIVFNKCGQAVQLRVLAHWLDGTVEDVTELTRFKTNDETVAAVAETGLVSCTGKGDSHVVVSYDNGVLPVPVMLAVSEFAGAKFPSSTTHSKVDELVQNKLRKVGIIPAEICTDAEFLRRVSLDMTGTLPTPDEVTKFIGDRSSGKRSAKVEELLKSPAYAALWATRFCDYTGNNPRLINLGGGNNKNRLSGEVSRQWYDWLYHRVATNQPYDKMVADIVLATSRSSAGQSYESFAHEMGSYFRSNDPADYSNHPTLAYYWQKRTVQSPEEKMLAFSHTFMGIRLECAQCHKHPFDLWTKTDFKEFAAFFSVINSSTAPAGQGNGMSYASIEKEMKEKVEKIVDARMAAEPAEPSDKAKMKKKEEVAANTGKPLTEKEKAEKAKLDKAKFRDTPEYRKRQMMQRELQVEYDRRIAAGEPVPWSEVWANTKGLKVEGKNKGGNFDKSIRPKILGGEFITTGKYADPRQPLMDWLRSKSNPYFTKAIVNRVWAGYFNRGIVDPPDDLNLANAPSNGELLNYLADGLAAHHYDLRWLHREIVNSDTYQRSWNTNATNENDTRNFSHAVMRQLPAEVMLDAIDFAVAPSAKQATFATQLDTRAIGPAGTSMYVKAKGNKGGGGTPDGYFLNLFGKPVRETNCDCERSADPTLLQTLFTRNDSNLLNRIDGGNSWIAEMRKSHPKGNVDADKAITEVFLRTVSRPPTQEELSDARKDVAAAKTSVDGVRDLMWAMINTREFKVNH